MPELPIPGRLILNCMNRDQSINRKINNLLTVSRIETAVVETAPYPAPTPIVDAPYPAPAPIVDAPYPAPTPIFDAPYPAAVPIVQSEELPINIPVFVSAPYPPPTPVTLVSSPYPAAAPISHYGDPILH